ncbi:sensor histidine kinase [Aliivibrio fischeri]|uniref:sensor histidine kinase n=1 Tax=Aliivibrio fischeri TaxID=668 RepID=UPI0007C4F8AA|nr:sensor histidine kinase [Aliivibrio fischeri]
MRSEQDLREQLEYLLNKNNKTVDYGMILDLASKLSEYDEKNVRFSVDGNLVKRLGEQLVAKKTTALSELIKNAYDAEAEKVDVIFENTEEPNGVITIFDDGNGMTRETLMKGFMTISTSDKEEFPMSLRYERLRAGRKGIGRFSAQKIGEHLRIITRTCAESPFLVVDIDWSNYQAKSNLLTVANSIVESNEDFGFEKGTKLIISKTREVWSNDNLSTSFKYIGSVIKNTPKELSSGIVDPGFKVIFYSYLPISGELLPLKNDDTEFLSEADAIIDAKINDEGKINININGLNGLSIQDSYELPEIKSEALKVAGFKFHTHYFTLARNSKRNHLTAYTNDNGGIKLYRNGFYVAPYGSRFNDWLGLDESSRKRRILPPHANTNFVGGIDILDFDGSLFEETSAREGLIENDFFNELRNTAYEVVASAVKRVAAARGRKMTSNQQGFKKEEQTLEEKIDTNTNKIFETLGKFDVSNSNTTVKPDADTKNLDLFISDETEDSTSVVTSEIAESLKASFDEQKLYIQELIDEKNMYRVLASSGLAIAEFTHEIQLYLNGLMLNGKQLKRCVGQNEIALDSANKMESNIDMLVSYTDFFTETIRSNSQRTKNVLEIRDVFGSFFKAMKPTIDRRAYELELSYQGDDFWTKPMHISELSSVLMNLFTNACKAIVRSGQCNGKIKVYVSSSNDEHIIRFEDNGDGIPQENWGRVFNALFTTELSQNAYSSESHQMRGMGLGLTITQDIISGIDGEISVVKPSEGYKTCIEIILPKADEEEVPTDAY